ncbi:MAG TPA: hypothetical protein PLL30_16295 [Candidatus Krumholzibacteria bacterium]|nr:hypothetical protein [Candidatus Krumholzibacteria bacterium]HPD73332.1 hypothetical protein [Candidatus Krumholzibacteria bacterium]HRY42147.1 hypothetical protein [Candidatus Krumholzibacteria bacterium]
MTHALNAIIAIIVVHAGIGLLQWYARRVADVGRMALYGMYLTLLPIGLACFGILAPVYLIAGLAVVGQILVVMGIRKSKEQVASA